MGAEHESSHQTGDSATVAVGGAPAGAVEGLTGVPGLGLASAIGNAAFSALVTGSGTAAGAAARLMRQPKPEPEPEDADPDAARKKEFGERTFSKAVHEPPTGGRFGITYRPGAGQLTVAVRVLFDWQDFPEAQASKDEKPYCKWTADEKERWSSEFCARIAARWSEKHAIRCTKPGWEEFTANPVVKVEPVGGGAAHFTVRVHKDIGGDRVRAGVSTPRGDADFSESNIQPEHEIDPNEARQKEAEILEKERTRLSAALGALAAGGANPIAFPRGGHDVPVPLRAKLWELGRALAAANPSAPRFPVQVLGESKDEGGKAAELALARAHMVGTIVNGTAAGYPVRVSSRPEGEARRATVSIGDPQEGWSNRYSVAEHEFGHMLGNPDEYHDPEHEHDAAKRKAWIALVESAGVSVPMKGEEASTSSQMSKGTDVLPAHYVTIWDALGELTSAYVTRAEWSLEG